MSVLSSLCLYCLACVCTVLLQGVSALSAMQWSSMLSGFCETSVSVLYVFAQSVSVLYVFAQSQYRGLLLGLCLYFICSYSPQYRGLLLDMCMYCMCSHSLNIEVLEGTGAYGPLLLAPAEGLGGPSGPRTCGGIYFNN